MDLLLQRLESREYFEGNLYCNGTLFCNTLELPEPIPCGEYAIDFNTVSPRFKNRAWAKLYGGRVPRLINVPGHSGILIHPGNTVEDTSGCILVGKRENVNGYLFASKATYLNLCQQLETARINNETILLSIE